MREIRLRAWDGERMHTFDNFTEILDYCDISGWNVRPNNPNYRGEWICGESQSKKPFDLMQFTGLYDKNKKPIYEGDILEARFQDERFRTVVEFVQGMFGYDPKEEGGNKHALVLLMSYQPEVIGNMYEHPHLIK